MRCPRSLVRLPILALAVVLMQGCTALTRFESVSPGTTLTLRSGERLELPAAVRLDSKATGQHEFVATASSGKTLYGILPLSVSGGKMAVSILLFAPALFIGGFRDVFPYYQVDPETGLLRYKSKEQEDWRLYQPTSAESNRARLYFDGAGKAESAAAGAIAITVAWPNATPEAIEREVVAPLESRLKILPRLSQVRSVSTHGSARFDLFYAPAAQCADVKAASEALASAQSSLPSGISAPKLTATVANC